MRDTITAPQTGPCHVTMWPLVNGKPQGPGQVLGIGCWEDLLDLAAKHPCSRPTYDLFDIENPDGSVSRYRAYDLMEAA